MPRALRIEYPGAIYHVMNRGDHREPTYSITAAKLTAFKKKIDAYDSVKTSSREKIVQRSAANQLLPQLIRSAVNILNDPLDGLMVQFKSDQPNFYEEYFSARAIVSARGGQSNTDDKNSSLNTPTPSPTPTPQSA